jgi:hypothetical protein
MKMLRVSTAWPFALLVLATLILLAPALRPGYMLLPAGLPFIVDPLWQPLAPPNAELGANPVLSDQFYQYHAWKTVVRSSLAHGEIPWWTSATNGGQPLLTNGQMGLFDPFHLVEMLFPLEISYVASALLRLWVAGLFAYLYARTLAMSRAAALLAMFAYTFSGPLVSWLGATPSHVFAWFPALLWVGEKWLAARNLAWTMTASALLALLLFSSQPEIAFQIAIVWAVYLVLRATWLEGAFIPALRRHAAWWLLAAAVGLALAAVETLPFIATLRESAIFSHRTTSPDLAGWMQRALFHWQQWPTLITALLPHFLGREADNSYWYPGGNTIENNAYAGVLPLLLALLALWRAWRGPRDNLQRWIWLWGALGSGALALALNLPLVAALNELPPLNLVEPGRFRAIYVFAVAILAGFGLDVLRGESKHHRALVILLIVAAALNGLLIAAAYAGFTRFTGELIASGRQFMQANVGSPELDRPLEELYALVETRHAAKLAMLRPSNPIMYVPLMVAAMVAPLVWQPKRVPTQWLASALVTITALDLLWIGSRINGAAPATWLERTPPVIEQLHAQPGTFRVVGTHLILNPNMGMLAGLEDVRGYDPLASARYRRLLEGLDGFAPSGYHHYFRHLDDPRLDLFNAEFGLSRTSPAHARWQPVFTDPSGITLYRNASALPRAFLVYSTQIVEDETQSLAQTLDAGFDPRRSVILEEEPARWTPPPLPPTESSEVTLLERGANRVLLEAETPVPALLVLLESYVPGWRATVGDQLTPIYAANHAFRAIVLPAGAHRVTFTYTPPLLALGAATSAVAWLALLATMVWLRLERKQVAA